MEIKSYENLIVWQKSMDLVVLVYKLTEKFPKEEIYGLTSQMRRSAVSIPSNIAEGSRRSSRKDFRNFLLNAYGSGAELETQIKISKRLHFCKNEDYLKIESLLSEVMRILNKLTNNLKN
jgi:four helix bundle protein